MNKLLKKYILVVFLFYSCASPAPPSGGPPDRTPPVITSVEPSTKTINYKGDGIQLDFSKYMDKNSVIENTSLSPVKNMEFDWSGKSLDIHFSEPLDSNTTFALTLGTDYQDLKGNKPEEAFTLIFSTGPILDSGKITGILFDEKPAGIYIYAYSKNLIGFDTLNPAKIKPNYKIQVGNSGKFEFQALKPGKYRLFSVKDQYKDGIYDVGIDAISTAYSDVMVKPDSNPDIRLKAGTILDITGPELYDAEAISDKMIIANFSEPLDTSFTNADAFEITDSSGIKKMTILSASISLKHGNKAEIVTANSLDTSVKWKLIAINDPNRAIRDTSGNIIQDTARSTFFYAVSETDTSEFKLLKIPFADSSKNINPGGYFVFQFNSHVNRKNFEDRISFRDSKTNGVKFSSLWKTACLVEIKPDKKLANDSWYELSVRLDSLKNQSGQTIKRDTTIILRFKTIDVRTYGSVSGFYRDSVSICQNPLIALVSKESKNRYTTEPGDSGKWEFREIPPGNYYFEIICDADGDGRYSQGSPYPYINSELFYVFLKEINIKPRWKIENVILNFPR